MKPKKMLFVAASAALFGLVNSVSGQYGTAQEGGSAMPKVQDLLNEQEPIATIAPATVVATTSYEATADDRIAASPKVRDLFNQRKTMQSTPSGDEVIVAYDQRFRESASTFMIAPLATPED